ncbi:MAG TPA: chromate transporter [Burkholderiaceae bacterium]|nr:chromate transporter [Burkholderiaceae bacterium]
MEEPLRAPHGPAELFRVFNRLALQGFGGVLPVAQRELVERQQWLTREDFVELLSVAQVLPGPNVVNLALMLGDRYFGWRGAMAALAGMLCAPLVLVLTLAVLYTHYQEHPVVAGALRGMGAAAAGLVFSTGLKLLPALGRNALGARGALGFTLATFALVALARMPLLAVLLVLGAASCAWAWRRLAP